MREEAEETRQRVLLCHRERFRRYGDVNFKKSALEDLAGQQFGRLTAIEVAVKKPSVTWKCKCICGNTAEVRASYLKSGHTRSCGCLHLERAETLNRTHGMTDTGTYRSWVAMRRRCTDKSYRDFHLYGGRGISVCERWMSSFENFLEDMGERPKGRTLDREDNDGNYEPGNCRWATPKEQRENRR